MTAAAFFSWILTREGLSRLLQTAMTGFAASYSETALVLMCVLVFLIVGCFMDTSAAVLLLAPIIIPVVKSVGIDPIYFGVLMVLGLMVGIITPPFGICLFVVSGVAKIPRQGRHQGGHPLYPRNGGCYPSGRVLPADRHLHPEHLLQLRACIQFCVSDTASIELPISRRIPII